MGVDTEDGKAERPADSKQKSGSVPTRTPELQLDQGVERGEFREKWWQLWYAWWFSRRVPCEFSLLLTEELENDEGDRKTLLPSLRPRSKMPRYRTF